MIASGEKKEEYREIKMYWWKRLVQCGECYDNFPDSISGELAEPANWKLIMSKHYDLIKFKNGYSKNCPSITVECKGIDIGYGKYKWGATDKCFIIKLGEIITKPQNFNQ